MWSEGRISGALILTARESGSGWLEEVIESVPVESASSTATAVETEAGSSFGALTGGKSERWMRSLSPSQV